MEFGKVDPSALDAIDFNLPPDRPETARVLSAEAQTGHGRVFVGCAKWGRKDWIGKVYPPGTKEADFLPRYASQFNCIELNATFYKIPSARQAQEWSSKVGPQFQFSPKVPSSISHIHRLKNPEERMARFLNGISSFGRNLGPVFLMPHPGMGPKTFETLESFVAAFPKDIPLFVELRHPEWFSDTAASSAVFDMFERHGAGAVITDVAGNRECLHMRLTTPRAFIRFVGNNLHPTDYTRIDQWVQRIKRWLDLGIRQVSFFMHQNEEVYSPVLARYAIEQLNRHCDTRIPVPVFAEDTADTGAIKGRKK